MEALAERKAAEFHDSFIGRTAQVLFETQQDGIWNGLTGNYIRVYTDAPGQNGELYTLKLTRLYKDGLWGELAACK